MNHGYMLYQIHEAWQSLIQRQCSYITAVISDNAILKQVVIRQGLIPGNPEKSLKTSFSDLAKAAAALCSLSLSM